MREMLREKKELSKKHIDKKLRNRMIMYFIMSVAVLGFVIYEFAIGVAPLWIALAAIVL